jgi:hypothetical protein
MATVIFLIQPEGLAGSNAPNSNESKPNGLNQSLAHMKLFTFGLDDLTATVKAVGADMVTQMRFTRGRLNGQRRVGQKIVRTMHATLGRGLFVLLNSHFLLLKNRGAKIQ